MTLLVLIKGLLLGFGLSLPIGPVGILCLRHSLTKGRRAGMIAGLGAATADMIYAAFAAYGISFIINPIKAHHHLFQSVAGLFLISFGIHLYFFPPSSPKRIMDHGKKSVLFNYLSTFLLTLSNPTTILLFVTLFAVLGIEDISAIPLRAAMLVATVFGGACLGWLTLTSTAHHFRSRITMQVLDTINTFASGGIILFGLAALISCFL